MRRKIRNNIINENSDICARLVPTRKFVLFVYLKNFIISITINGLNITTTKERIRASMAESSEESSEES